MPTILNRLLKDPALATDMTIAQWEMCIRQALVSNMTGRLWYILQQAQVTDAIPHKVQLHFNTAQIKADCQSRDITFEVQQLTQCLAEIGVEPVFLKGAAYVIAKSAHQGRICNDIDILVAPDKLQATERQLGKEGWISEDINAYDDQYYRKWMHELPPMVHLNRQTTLDVHHHLLPKTVKNSFNIDLMLNAAQTFDFVTDVQTIRIKTLSSVDRILHSCCHLFTEGNLDKGLRDLTDIQIMLKDLHQKHGQEASSLLIKRAFELGLDDQLMLATRYIARLLANQIDLSAYLEFNWLTSPFSSIRNAILDWCYKRLFIPHHHKVKGVSFYFADAIILLRSHLQKMPMRMLIPHLGIKCWLGVKEAIAQK